MIKSLRNLSLVIIFAIAYSCATPSSPTGGPPDKQGPKITETEPKTGTVNFDGNTIELHFSEFVKRSSLQQALTVEPEIGLTYKLDWGRKSVAIKFDRNIPESTTLIVTVGTDFTDTNGNKMESPTKVAISTGPEIDKGKLIGKVLDARTGKGGEGQRVLLYRSPGDLSQPANYIGESDTSGVVNFSYLREGKYKAFWVDDRNRNKIWDADQERAQPFGDEFVALAKAGEDTLGTLFIANSDTSKPKLQGIGLFSSQRLRLRFSENISTTDSTNLQVQDSTGSAFANAYPLYISPDDKYVLFAYSEKKLSPNRSFQFNVRNIADEAENVQPVSSQTFTGSAQEDTTKQRIVGMSVDKGIFPNEPVTVAYAAPITHASVRDSLKVVEGNDMITPWKNLEIERNKVRILPDGAWKEGKDYTFKVWNPIIQDYNSIKPTIWHEPDLGSLHMVFADTTSEEAQRPTHLTLQMAGKRIVADTTFIKEVTIDSLAPIKHQLKLYQDRNNNGNWDAGKVAPYVMPEPYYIQNDIPVQSGFTSDLKITFKE